MRGGVSRCSINEDLYAEKDRLQQKFIEENPQEELSRLLQATGTGAAASTCPAGTIDIGAMEVPAAEWRLTSVATAKVLPGGHQHVPGGRVPLRSRRRRWSSRRRCFKL